MAIWFGLVVWYPVCASLFDTPSLSFRYDFARLNSASTAALHSLDSAWKFSYTASGLQLQGSLGSTGLPPMPPQYSRHLGHGPDAGSGLLPRLPPPACSRPVSGVVLGLFVCGLFTGRGADLAAAAGRESLRDLLRLYMLVFTSIYKRRVRDACAKRSGTSEVDAELFGDRSLLECHEKLLTGRANVVVAIHAQVTKSKVVCSPRAELTHSRVPDVVCG